MMQFRISQTPHARNILKYGTSQGYLEEVFDQSRMMQIPYLNQDFLGKFLAYGPQRINTIERKNYEITIWIIFSGTLHSEELSFLSLRRI